VRDVVGRGEGGDRVRAGVRERLAIGHNAALLPDATTVRVVLNGQPHEVPLTRR